MRRPVSQPCLAPLESTACTSASSLACALQVELPVTGVTSPGAFAVATKPATSPVQLLGA